MNYATSYPQATVRCVCIFNPAEVHKNWVKFGKFWSPNPIPARTSDCPPLLLRPMLLRRPGSALSPCCLAPPGRLAAVPPSDRFIAASRPHPHAAEFYSSRPLTPHFSPRPPHTRSGGRKCRGRVEMFALCLKALVGACRIALHGQNHPPSTGLPSAASERRERGKIVLPVPESPSGASERRERLTKSPSGDV